MDLILFIGVWVYKKTRMQFENYSIRPIQETDLQPFYKMIEQNRKRLERFFAGTILRTRNIEDTERFLQEIIEKMDSRLYFAYVIIDEETDGFVGFLDLKNIEWRVPKSEIGFYIDAAYEGKGITGRALTMLCDHCFGHFGFEKLFLRTHESNLGARGVAEHCGFEKEGTLRRDYKTSSGELVDVLYYGKIR